MPFNKKDNLFYDLGSNGELIPKITDNIGNIGEAIGDWKPDFKNYERIQGIVMDTRYLMYNYIAMPEQEKKALCDCIEKVNSRGTVPK